MEPKFMPYLVRNIYHNSNFRLLISLGNEEDLIAIWSILRNKLTLMFCATLLKVWVELRHTCIENWLEIWSKGLECCLRNICLGTLRNLQKCSLKNNLKWRFQDWRRSKKEYTPLIMSQNMRMVSRWSWLKTAYKVKLSKISCLDWTNSRTLFEVLRMQMRRASISDYGLKTIKYSKKYILSTATYSWLKNQRNFSSIW